MVQRRAHAVELLTDVIARLPADWGPWPDEDKRRELAGRLVFLNWMVREKVLTGDTEKWR